MKITALIPARKNSVRFPGKNYAPFLGRPLFMHSVDFARKSEFISEYFVTTNDIVIIEYCKKNDIPFILRPEKYCTAKAPSSSFIEHFLQYAYINNLVLPTALLILQPTNPIRNHQTLEKIIQLFNKKRADSVFTVVKSEAKLGVITNGIFSPYNYNFEQRSQDMTSYYEENGMFYLIRVKAFLEYHSFFGKTNIPFVIEDFFTNVDIDKKHELKIAEMFYNDYFEK